MRPLGCVGPPRPRSYRPHISYCPRYFKLHAATLSTRHGSGITAQDERRLLRGSPKQCTAGPRDSVVSASSFDRRLNRLAATIMRSRGASYGLKYSDPESNWHRQLVEG